MFNVVDETGFVERVASFYRALGFCPGDCVAVAFSGGADSVALLAATCAAGFKAVALHCNFHLRGDESDRDERFARRMAAELGCGILVRHCDVGARRAATGESVEMACRSLRYEWFVDEFNRAAGAWRCIAVGHHADDNVETFFLNLVRGTGLRGLGGIKPVRDMFVRPLLKMSRTEIMAFLDSVGLGFVVDSSNLSCDYRRNIIRNRLLPVFEADFPGVRGAVTVTCDNLRRDRELLDFFVSRVAAAYVASDGTINLSGLASDECAPTLLYHILNMSGCRGRFSYAAAETIMRNPAASGTMFLAVDGKFGYVLDRWKLVPFDVSGVSGVDDEEYDLSEVVRGCEVSRLVLPVPLSVSCVPVTGFHPVRDARVLWLDADAVEKAVNTGRRLIMRHWRDGDRMAPFGMKGTRLVSDLFSDAKLSIVAKRNVWLLVCGNDILWIPGIRTSRHFTVGSGTQTVLRLSLTE